jgi:hypothetical protein
MARPTLTPVKTKQTSEGYVMFKIQKAEYFSSKQLKDQKKDTYNWDPRSGIQSDFSFQNQKPNES